MIRTDKIWLILLIATTFLISVAIVSLFMVPEPYLGVTLAASGEGENPARSGELDQILESLQQGWEVFRSEGYGFEISFPDPVQPKSMLDPSALNAGVGVSPDAAVWEFSLESPEYYRGTNLVDASLLIHVLQDPRDTQNCSEFKPGSSLKREGTADSPPEVSINGITFWKDEVVEGGMGKLYRTIQYRTLKNGVCYQITQLIQTRNLDFLPDEKIEEVDQAALIRELDTVLETFTFLEVKPTFPKQVFPEAKTFSEALPKSTSYVDGIDVSHWQGTVKWAKVGNAGYEFAFVKGTEGVGWTDVNFIENMENGPNSGVIRGVYHFARPDLGNTGREEAEYFLEVAGDYLESGNLRPVLDLEVRGNLNKTQLSNWTLEWLDTVKNRTGVSPLIYTNLNYVNYYLTSAVTEYDIWIAYWSCSANPSYSIPPTGKWRDWAFWQYYGPGGCGGNAGYVPGIQTNIDLNIFNGVSAGLSEYNAASKLWVSLTSDAYLVPVPYYADLTANVNGDAAGPVDYAFWWDCEALEADVASVEGTCGALPVPDPGTCLENENGMRCLGVDTELQLAEHTYQEIGDYSPKVIVEQAGESPAEDRYKISTYNPLSFVKTDLTSPGEGVVEEIYELEVKVEMDTTVSGALQVEVIDQQTDEVDARLCKTVPADFRDKMYFNLDWTEVNSGLRYYKIQTRYRAHENCPVEDIDESDLSIDYLINWNDPEPILSIERPLGTKLILGAVDDLGQRETGRMIELEYLLSNPIDNGTILIESILLEELDNITSVSIEPDQDLEISAGETQSVQVAFEIENTGPFSYQLAVNHDGENPSPYQITGSGEGVTAPDPIQSLEITPGSPAEIWINENLALDVLLEVDLQTPGALQVEIVEPDGITVADRECRIIESAGAGQETFQLNWTEEDPGEVLYQAVASFRSDGSCPILDSGSSDLIETYEVSWMEELPTLALKDDSGADVVHLSEYGMGELDFYETASLEFVLENPSRTSSLEVDGIEALNLEGLSAVEVLPSGPFILGPGQTQSLAVAFLVEDTGPLSFDLMFNHQGDNSSPYQVTVTGTGVMTADPLSDLRLSPDPAPETLIGNSFQLQAAATAEIPASGAVQIQVLDQGLGGIRAESCQVAEAGQNGDLEYQLSWTESLPQLWEYQVEAVYLAGSGCPVSSDPNDLLTGSYQITWTEETPSLILERPAGNILSPDDSDPIGEYEFYQELELVYLLTNQSTTSPMQITDLRLENPQGVGVLDLDTEVPLSLGAEETVQIPVRFRVEEAGSFQLDLVIEHDGENNNPYIITIDGSGVITENWISYLTPDPLPPAASLIGNPFQMDLEVGLSVPGSGALQAEISESGSGSVVEQSCREITNNFNSPRNFRFAWVENQPGKVDYQIETAFKAGGNCPLGSDVDAERVQEYTLSWVEIQPSLDLEDLNGASIPTGGNLSLGQSGLGQPVELSLLIQNPSPTTALEVSGVQLENHENIGEFEIVPAGPLTVEPEGTRQFNLVFQTIRPGNYTFDLKLIHNGENPSPYAAGVNGNAVLVSNPIQAVYLTPDQPGTSFTGDTYSLKAEVLITPPVDGTLGVQVVEPLSGDVKHEGCLAVSGGLGLSNQFDFNWTESGPGLKAYQVQAFFRAAGSCPLSGEPDAELSVEHQVTWEQDLPVLEIKRPEGVTIAEGSQDYVGSHPWFEFVEVTYLLENKSQTAVLDVDSITADNLDQLRRVNIDQTGPFQLGPGEEKTIKMVFLLLTEEPFSFDLLVETDGTADQVYEVTVAGDTYLDLESQIQNQWLQDWITRLLQDGFFLRLPDSILDLVESYLVR